MLKILRLNSESEKYLRDHNLQSKFSKQIALFQYNPRHPGLHTELLEPSDKGIYSFRLDRKYRVLFIWREDRQAIEILVITAHYR